MLGQRAPAPAALAEPGVTGRGWLTGATCAGLVLLALALRWPYVGILPRFTDETLEVLHSLAIARGEIRPLINYDSYYGALFNYLIAAPLALLGPDPLVPRLTVMTLGALTVIPAYLLGARLGGRAVGWMSAGLMATSSAHVAVNSHIAWSNCLTPLFTTMGWWLLARAQMARSGWSLVLGGLCFGLALQTHPAVIAFAPAIAIFVLTQGWHATSWRWVAGAAAAAMLGYANMIAYNLTTDFDSIRSGQRISVEYAQADDADAGLHTVGAMLLLLVRLASGAVDQRTGPWDYLLDPSAGISLLLAGAGLIVLARRGMVLPALAVLAYLVILPMVNTKFRTLVTIRYLMPLYPLLAAGMAVAVIYLARRISTRATALRATVIALALVAVMLPQLVALQRYYDRLLRQGDTNERILHLAGVIRDQRQPQELVLVDDGMGSELPGTGVTEVRGFRYLLTMADVPHRSVRLTPRRIEEELASAPSVLVVMNARDAEQAERRLAVQSLEGRARPVIGRGSDFQVYRVMR